MEEYIREFGERNRHLANGAPGAGFNRTELRAAWFVSHCATQSRREKFVKAMRRVAGKITLLVAFYFSLVLLWHLEIWQNWHGHGR